MNTLKKLVEKAIEGSKEYLRTLYDVNESVEVYNDICNYGIAYTINSNVVRLCKRCSLKVVAEGIGWKIEEVKGEY